MEVRIRPGRAPDAAGMASILAPIVDRGGLTAIQGPVDAGLFGPLFAPKARAILHVAEADGRLFGFQWVEFHPALPTGTADIATFCALDAHRRGLGRRLFEATRRAAAAAGWTALNASVLETNALGLGYYPAMGFREVGRSDGKVHHRRGLADAL